MDVVVEIGDVMRRLITVRVLTDQPGDVRLVTARKFCLSREYLVEFLLESYQYQQDRKRQGDAA